MPYPQSGEVRISAKRLGKKTLFLITRRLVEISSSPGLPGHQFFKAEVLRWVPGAIRGLRGEMVAEKNGPRGQIPPLQNLYILPADIHVSCAHIDFSPVRFSIPSRNRGRGGLGCPQAVRECCEVQKNPLKPPKAALGAKIPPSPGPPLGPGALWGPMGPCYAAAAG